MSETRSVETSAADIETAIELGLEELGVTRESVIVEIIEEPSRGLLGIGARQARVRLTTAAPPRQERPPVREPLEEEAAPSPPPAPRRAPAPQPQPVGESEMDEDARVGLETLQELLERMHIRAQVEVFRAAAAEGETAPWVLQIHGQDLGVLIGRRGETLSALQYITRLIASRELQRRANIVLDVEGYKARREKVLQRLAQRMADQAVRTGRIVSLEPMPPYERRIVHLALRDRDDVSTESVGEGSRRKVTIIPQR